MIDHDSLCSVAKEPSTPILSRSNIKLGFVFMVDTCKRAQETGFHCADIPVEAGFPYNALSLHRSPKSRRDES